MSRKLAFWIVALLALVTLIFANKQPAPGTNWVELIKTRRKNAYARDLVALETFLKGQVGGMADCSFGYLYDGFRDNTSYLDGTLLQDWKVAGRLQIHFYYDGLQPEASSHEVHMVFKPEMMKQSLSEEWKSLLKQTMKQKELRTTFGDIQWFSFVNEQGDIDLTMRIPSPTRWYPNVPEYDRGFTDEMYFGVARKAISYLFQEAFQDQYTKLELQPPSFNPPSNVSHRPLGNVYGFIYPKDGPPLHLAIETSSDSNDKNVDLHITLKPWGDEFLNEAQVKALFKPEFLARLNRNSSGKITFNGGPLDQDFYVAINGPLEAFPEPKPR